MTWVHEPDRVSRECHLKSVRDLRAFGDFGYARRATWSPFHIFLLVFYI